MIGSNRKAQAGLEYLLTYGWALILIATVVGVLVFIVGTSTSTASFSVSDPTKFLIKGGAITDGIAKIKLQNITGGKIEVSSAGGCTMEEGQFPLTVLAGGTMTMVCGVQGGAIAVSMNYKDYAGLERSVSIASSGTTGTGAVQGTIAYYAFDEGSGTTAHDGSGNANNGSIANASFQTAGCKSGSCLYFNGSSAKVNVPPNTSLDLTGSMSMSAWINFDKTIGSTASIIKKGSSSANYQLFLSDNGSRINCGDSAGSVRTKEHILLPGMDYSIGCSVSGTDAKIYANTRKEPLYTMGDSITEGFPQHSTSVRVGTASGDITYTYQYWLDRLMKSYTSAETTISYYNLGWAGQHCHNMRDRFTTNIPPGVEVILMCGTNDIRAGDTAAQVETYIQEIYAIANPRGNTLYIMDIPPYGTSSTNPCMGATQKTHIQNYNNWLDSFAALNPNVHIIHHHTALTNGTYGCINYAYFLTDYLHPNIAGQQKIAEEIWKQAFNSRVYGLSEQLTETSGSWNGIETVNADSLSVGESFKGTIDNVAVFNRALGAGEFGALFGG